MNREDRITTRYKIAVTLTVTGGWAAAIFYLVKAAVSEPTVFVIGRSAFIFLLLMMWLWELNKYVYYEIWKEK